MLSFDMKKTIIEIPQKYSNTIYDIYRYVKKQIAQQNWKFGSSQWEIANALDRIESRIRNGKKQTPAIIELSYDDAVYLYRAIAVYMDELNTNDLLEFQNFLEKQIGLHT